MADWLEAFVPLRVHVLIRFGRWDELIAEPLPGNTELYCSTTATIHYGRGVAHAAKGQIERARASGTTSPRPTRGSRSRATCSTTPAATSRGRRGHARRRDRFYREGDYERAFAHLRRAIALDDALPYDEPWGWMQPTGMPGARCCSNRPRRGGRRLRRRPRPRPTLSRPCQHPNNVWSLHGYHECLTRQGRTAEAAIIARQLDVARARADVPIVASCACRLDVQPPSCCAD